MQTGNPYAQYKNQSLATLAPGEILIKLFDESIKQLHLAVLAIEQKNYASVDAAIGKANAIVNTLNSSLDMRYPISKELRPMYVFLSKQFTSANIQKNTKLLNDCIPLLKDLRASFSQAEKINRQKQHAMAQGG